MKRIIITVSLVVFAQIPALLRAQELFPSCTLQDREDDRSNGRFVYKNEGNHFRNNAVVLAPRCYYVTTKRSSPIAVELFTADGATKIGKLSLKTTGYCPGNPECLGASTYLAPKNGKFYKRRYGSIVVKIRPRASGPRCGCSYYVIADPSKRIAYRAPVVEAN